MGKITVIKTLGLPKLVYLMSVLPDPIKDTYNKIEILIRKFLWVGKEKISLAQLQKDISKGGLKLTNLFLFNRALKLCWVKRLVEGNGNWQKLFETMQGLNKKHMWQLDQQSLLDIEKRISNFFWRNVIAHWRYFITLHPYEVVLRKIPIFGSNLLNNDNLLMKRSSFEAEGLIYFNDLFDANGNLYGYENFVNSFAVNINFVDFIV